MAGRLHNRVWGKGAEKVMPANGRELVERSPGYRQLLTTLDLFVSNMVPGDRKKTSLGRLVLQQIRNRVNKVCGSIPNGVIVVVVEKSPRERPGTARIFRPADKYLNGECTDDDGYYLPANRLSAP